MVGVAVVTLFTVFAASVKAAIDDTVSKQFTGDLVIASQNFSRGRTQPADDLRHRRAARGRHRHRAGRRLR